MKKGACVFTALIVAISMVFSGCSPELLSKLSGGKAVPQLTVDVNLTNKTEDKVFVQTAVPVFGGFDSAKILNSKIQDLVDQGVEEVREMQKELDKNPERPPVLLFFQSFFDYSENGDILSVWNTFSNYTGGAHGLNWIRSFTVNRKTGEFYDTLGSIFQDEAEGKKLITDKIIAEIRKKPDVYFPEAEKTVREKNGDFLYYIDGSNLVVYFDLYEIAPYVYGTPSFTFPLKDLKTKVETIGIPAGNVRKNGMSWGFARPVVSNESGVFLPLEDMTNALNHKLEYKDGKHTIDGKAVQLVMNSAPYVPLEFFRETLGDFVIYYDGVLRMFTQTGGKGGNGSSSGSLPSAASKP
jgi:hypothetical protein